MTVMTRGTDTRQRIIDAARDLLYTRSYGDVGVQAICERAGVKKGSFYHFFPSKQALTLAVIEEHLLISKRQILDQAFDPAQPPLERIRRFAARVYEVQKELRDLTGQVLGCPFGNLALEMSTQDETLRRELQQVFRRLEGLLRDTVQEAVARGELPGPVDAAATARAMLAYMEGVMLLAKTANDVELLRQLMPALTRLRVTPAEADGAAAAAPAAQAS